MENLVIDLSYLVVKRMKKVFKLQIQQVVTILNSHTPAAKQSSDSQELCLFVY